MWLKDPKTKEKSVTLTFFTWGFLVALFKLTFSGAQVGDFHLQQFTGTDFAAVAGALGAIYAMRRSSSKESSNGN